MKRLKVIKESRDDMVSIIIKDGRYSDVWYVKKIDSTHVEMWMTGAGSRGAVWHIAQLKDKPYYEDLKKWLATGNKKVVDKQIYTENTMKIKRSELKEMVRKVMLESRGEEYEAFFNKALEKFGVDSPEDFETEEEKKKFFNWIELNWTGEKTEENLEEFLGEFPEFGKRKAGDSSRAQRRKGTLAMEQKIRKLVREELKFVMFADKDGSAGHKVQKRRIQKDLGV